MYREIVEYIIRDWRIKDAPSIAKYANNRKIWMNLRDAFPYPYSLQDAESFISRIIEADPITVFAIATQSEVIGSIGLMVGNDVHRYTAEMGYWLAEPYWGKGIMTQAVKSMTSYAVRNLKLHRIFAEPYSTNPASVIGIGSIEVEPLQLPTKDNGNFAICRASVVSKIGESFTDIVDANPTNCNAKVGKHLLRLASTRAIARALRSFSNVGLTALEELADLNDVMGKPIQK